MKLSRLFIPCLSAFMGALVVAQAAPPIINSPPSETVELNTPINYPITTVEGDAILYNATGLPAGLNLGARTGVISGTPIAGDYLIKLYATNRNNETSSVFNLQLKVTNPIPAISSELSISVPVGTSFTYTITAENTPTSFSVIGLNVLPTDATGISQLADQGIFSFTPSSGAEGDSYNLIINASNDAGSDTEVLKVNILPATTTPPNLASVTAGPVDAVYPGTTTSIPISATVIPAAGESIDTVFVRWLNPPNKPDGDPRLPILMTNLVESSANTYTGSVNVGFNPDDRQLTGGEIQLEIVAYQSNSVTINDFASATMDTAAGKRAFTIAPLAKFLFPNPNFASDQIAQGGVFASVRISSGIFQSASARITGAGLSATVIDDDPSDNTNGVFNFFSPQAISLPGTYTITVTAIDSEGNQTVVQGNLLISDTFGEPVAAVLTPTPGFRTEVFSPAVVSITSAGAELVGAGQGYFPRNQTNAKLHWTDEAGNDSFSIVPVDRRFTATIENGRVVSVDVPDNQTEGIYLLDLSTRDPGIHSRIPISAEFFKATADLESFQIFLDGQPLYPGVGGIIGSDVPLYTYPQTGSPQLGDHVVVAQVTDAQGEVGTSVPVSFSIVPFEPISIALSTTTSGDLVQGGTVVFNADVSPLNDVVRVEFFDSDTNASLGLGSRVTVGPDTFYRLTRTFNQQGNFGTYAVATTFDDRRGVSSPIRFRVLPLNDAVVTITSPIENQTIFVGTTLSFNATATATPGIESISWQVNNQTVQTDASANSSYDFVSGVSGFSRGSYTVTATAIDNFGNVVGAPEEIVVEVVNSDLLVSISSPVSNPTIVAGESLDFTAIASASLGVQSVDWFVAGVLVESDTASPYKLTREFASPGSYSVRAQATDSLGNLASSSVLTVTVNTPNPLLRDEDFLSDTFSRIIGRAPTNDERTEGLAQLNGDLASRSAYVASLLRSDALQTTTIAQLIFRTMTGEWPDASELNDARNVLTNGGTGVVSADALTLALIPEYEARFAVLNTDLGFMRQIFRNKHGVAPTAQSEVRLFNALVGGPVEFNGTFIPGYGGNVTAYATQFALDNELSGFIGVEGLPLTNIHYYSKPNAPESKTLLVTLVSTLLGVEPTDGEIAALSALSLEGAVSQVLQDPRYFGQFPTSDAESAFAQTMAGFGVFDINLNGPDDDADGDGQSNLMEIALGSDPTDAGDMTGTLHASIDGSDFVVTFLRLQDPSAGLIYTVQCSLTMAPGSWNDADPSASTTLAPDQSGVPAGYERIEFRIDMNTQDCAFVRVVVN